MKAMTTDLASSANSLWKAAPALLRWITFAAGLTACNGGQSAARGHDAGLIDLGDAAPQSDVDVKTPGCLQACGAPPASFCVDGTTLRKYAEPGTCTSGACSYAHTDVTCAAGCAMGACSGADPCSDVTCDTPPAPSCTASGSLTSYSSAGTCSAGVCSYASTSTPCSSGCQSGACVDDPCAGVLCNDPPSASCLDTTTLKSYAAAGSCNAGACSYASTSTVCTHGCANGECNGDPCVGVTCTDPPAPACLNSTSLRGYGASGTCSQGDCSYSPVDTTCTNGCSNGACNGNPCAGVTCASPPATYCSTSTTLRTFSTPGTCSAGACSYASTDTTCTAPDNATASCTGAVCSFVCAPGYVASGSSCVLGCQAGETLCNGSCTNTETDSKNCGACGDVCSPTTGCNAGSCEALPTVTLSPATVTIYGNSVLVNPVSIMVGDPTDGPNGLTLSWSGSSADLSSLAFAGTGAARTLTFSTVPTKTAWSTTLSIVVTNPATHLTAAAALRVNVLADAVVTVCTDDANIPGTLRYWINPGLAAMNGNPNIPVFPGTTITFQTPLTGYEQGINTITLISPITVSSQLKIEGPGPATTVTIDGNGAETIIVASAPLAISGLTLSDGRASSGGAIQSTSSLGIDSCTFSANNAAATGGAVYVAPASGTDTIRITNSNFDSNQSCAGGGALFMRGGAPATIAGNTFYANSCYVCASMGTDSSGGAVEDENGATYENDDFFVNSAANGGGAVTAPYGATFVNCNFARNSLQAEGSVGDTILGASSGSGVVRMAFSTVTESYGSEYNVQSFALYATSANNFEIKNSLISGNTDLDIGGPGTFVSGGYNMVDNISTASWTGAVSKDLVGSAFTAAFVPGPPGEVSTGGILGTSSAIGFIPLSACTDWNGNPVTTDYRGEPRPSSLNPSACDVGAYERQSTDP